MKQWIAHCQTCSWTGVRCREEEQPLKEKNHHLHKHPIHKVRVLVTGEEKVNLPPSTPPIRTKA
jgi:hypothetical protein